jgi:hypothetical protein
LCRMTQVNKAWYLVGYELLNWDIFNSSFSLERNC